MARPRGAQAQGRLPVKRMVFHEITEQAIEEAIEQRPRARHEARRGAGGPPGPRPPRRLRDVARCPGAGSGGASSAGRVQSVATRLVVERERERMAFRAATYWDLEGTLRRPADGHRVGVPAALVAARRAPPRHRPRLRSRPPARSRADAEVVLLDEDGAAALAGRLADADVHGRLRRSRSRSPSGPKAPFKTSTLQQEAARKLRFSAARTMSVAQRLYERGHITYMRTDSTTLSEQAVTGGAEPDPSSALRRGRTCPPSRARYREQGEERAGGARGDPARRRRDSASPERVARRARAATSGALRADLDAHGREPDGRRPRSQRHRCGSRGTSSRRRRPDRDLPGDRAHHRVPRLPRGVRRGSRRPRGRARGPRGDPSRARRGRQRRVRVARRRRATRRNRRRATPRRAWSRSSRSAASAGRPRTRASSTRSLRARLRVEEGHRARAVVDGVREARSCSSATSRTSSTTSSPRRWRRRSTTIAPRRRRGREVAARVLLRERRRGLCRSSSTRSTSPRSTRPRSTRSTSGKDADGDAEIVVRVWNNGESLHRATRRRPCPSTCRPTSSRSSGARSCSSEGAGGPRVLGDDPETGEPVLVAHRPLRPVRPARRAGGRARRRSPSARRCSRRWTPDTVTSRRPLDAAVAAARRRRRRRGHARSPRRTAATARTCKKGTGQPQPRRRGAALHRHRSRRPRRSSPSRSSAAGAGEAADRRARAAPRHGAPVRVLDGRFGPYVTDGTDERDRAAGVDPTEIDTRAGGRAAPPSARREGPAKKTTAKKRRQEEEGAAEEDQARAKKGTRSGPRRRPRRRHEARVGRGRGSASLA